MALLRITAMTTAALYCEQQSTLMALLLLDCPFLFDSASHVLHETAA